MKNNRLKENTLLEDIELTDWDAAEDFGSIEEMAYYLEGMFSDNNVMLMLDAINAVARAKGLNQIAIQADSLQGKNPTRDILSQILNNLGFSWEGKTIKPIE